MKPALAIVTVLLCCQPAKGGGPCSGVRGGCGRSSYRTSVSAPSYSSSPSSGCGTVNVRAYTRKDGTHVRAHTRSSPGCGGSKPNYRTSARTTPRTAIWNGTGSAPDVQDDDPSLYAPAPAKTTPPVPMTDVSSLPARYIVYFKRGRLKRVADYLEERNDYLLIGTERSRGRFPISMVDRIERIADAPDLPAHVERPVRRWADQSGSHHAEARYSGLEDGKVRLVKTDAKVSLVAFDNLSAADKSYVLAAIAEDQGK